MHEKWQRPTETTYFEGLYLLENILIFLFFLQRPINKCMLRLMIKWFQLLRQLYLVVLQLKIFGWKVMQFFYMQLLYWMTFWYFRILDHTFTYNNNVFFKRINVVVRLKRCKAIPFLNISIRIRNIALRSASDLVQISHISVLLNIFKGTEIKIVML